MGHLWWLHSNLRDLRAYISKNLCSAEDKYSIPVARVYVKEERNSMIANIWFFQKILEAF